MKLDYYKSEKGLFVSNSNKGYSGRREPISGKFKINGKDPQTTHANGWYFIDGEDEFSKFEKEVSGKRENYRWELKDSCPEPIAATLPKTISLEDSCEWYDDDDYYDYRIGSDCKHYDYAIFYTRTSDLIPPEYVEEEVELNFLGEIQSEWTNNPVNDSYTVYKTSYKHQGEMELDLKSIATYSELSQMMVSDLLIHNQPCSLSSKQTYNIVRRHILDNIDSRWAVVTSDYDFCFTVKKKIAVKPIQKKDPILKRNGRPYAKPRFKTSSVTHKTEEIFEMTHAEKRYKGYTSIKGFEGNNLQELAENIKLYLDELMDYINRPLSECECCKGTGHLFEDSFGMNDR